MKFKEYDKQCQRLADKIVETKSQSEKSLIMSDWNKLDRDFLKANPKITSIAHAFEKYGNN